MSATYFGKGLVSSKSVYVYLGLYRKREVKQIWENVNYCKQLIDLSEEYKVFIFQLFFCYDQNFSK